MSKGAKVLPLGILTGFAILGAEATFLRTLPSRAHAALALGFCIVICAATYAFGKRIEARRIEQAARTAE